MIELPSRSKGSSPPSIGQEYNAFLYATIGTDTTGNAITVLSAMARMDLDPWQEAAQLSVLSGKAAARRLASLIDAMPTKPSDSCEPNVVAERLIKLLPRPSGVSSTARPLYKTLLAYGALPASRKVLFALVLLIALALAPLWSFIQHPTPPPPNSTNSSERAATPGK